MKKDWEKEFENVWKIFTSKIENGENGLHLIDKDLIKSFISNLFAQKDKDCQEYKDYYDRRKERDCKIAQINYDLGWKKALKQFEEIVGEVIDKFMLEEYGKWKIGRIEAKQEIRDNLKALKDKEV